MIDLEKMREEVEYFVSAGLQTGVATEDVIELLDHIAQLQEEIQEQCRVSGMGAEREAGLLSKVSQLDKDARRYLKALGRAKGAINSMKVEAETAAQGDEQMMLEACEQISNEGLAASQAIDTAMMT